MVEAGTTTGTRLEFGHEQAALWKQRAMKRTLTLPWLGRIALSKHGRGITPVQIFCSQLSQSLQAKSQLGGLA